MWKLEDAVCLEWKLVKEIMTMNVELNVEAWRCSKFGMEAHEGNHDHECRTLAVANKQLAWYYLIWAELSQFCSYPQSPNHVGKRLHTNLRNIPLVNPTWIINNVRVLAHTLILPYLIHTCDVVYYLVWRVQWYTTKGNFLLVEFVFLKINWEHQIKSHITQLTLFDLFYNNNQNSNPPNYTRESTC